MPLNPKASVGTNLGELKKGPHHAKMAKKYGAKKAHQIDVAIALHTKDKGSKPKKSYYHLSEHQKGGR